MHRLLALVLFALITMSSARAQESHSPTLNPTLGNLVGVDLKSGERAPMRKSFGLAMTWKQPRGIVLLEFGVSSSFTEFDPVPLMITGRALPIKDSWAFGPSVLYAYNPWNNTHLAGAFLAPAKELKSGPLLVMPVGISCPLTAASCSANAAFKLVL